MALMYGAFVLPIPVLGALATLWAAFASSRWSDRYLWSAAMIFAAVELAAITQQFFRVPDRRAPWSISIRIHLSSRD